MAESPVADLVWALLIVAGVSVATGTLGGWAGRRPGKWWWIAVVVLAAAGTGAYLLWGREATGWTRVLPFAGVVVLSNPTPWLAAATAGVCLAQRKLPRWRRGVLAGVLVVAGFYVPVQTLWNTPPPTVPTWADGVALQTTPSTCTPAAAATLLREHGLEFTERGLAPLCLTNTEGTPLLGLYRGLRLATADTDLRPVMRYLTLDELRERPGVLPAVVSVRLTREADAREPRYRQRWGWILGVRHSVVFLGFDGPDHVWVGDPGVGRERWRLEHIRDLWVGDVTTLQAED